MVEHTPGPWYWQGNPDAPKDRPSMCLFPTKGGASIAIMFHADYTNPDARLIAAAPEMLEALEGLYTYEDGKWWHSMDVEQKARVDAAIAKARGKTAMVNRKNAP